MPEQMWLKYAEFASGAYPLTNSSNTFLSNQSSELEVRLSFAPIAQYSSTVYFAPATEGRVLKTFSLFETNLPKLRIRGGGVLRLSNDSADSNDTESRNPKSPVFFIWKSKWMEFSSGSNNALPTPD